VGPQELAWERIFFPAAMASVQSATVAVDPSLLTGAILLPTPVSPDRTLLFFSGQGPAGQASGETSSTLANLGLSTAAPDFASAGAGQVSVTRGATGSGASFNLFAVQFAK
jgi:hypothetical protein